MDTSYERITDGKDEWLTPPEVIKALGTFDLDPCAPVKRPWNTALAHYTKNDNGLVKPWVWLNPPYGRETATWLRRLVKHGNGVALTFARTETRMFFECVWDKADAVLFLKGRLTFLDVHGKPKLTPQGSPQSAGAPSVLIAYGKENVKALQNCGLKGKFIKLKE